MFALDLNSLIRVGIIPHAEMEKYFDQAEYWLRSKTAHVVRVFTLGYINPRKMVAEEVRKALVDAGESFKHHPLVGQSANRAAVLLRLIAVADVGIYQLIGFAFDKVPLRTRKRFVLIIIPNDFTSYNAEKGLPACRIESHPRFKIT